MKSWWVVFLVTSIAANPSATIIGRVTDPTGGTLADVDAQLINVETGARFSTRTNDEGLYRLPNIPPGMYRFVLEKHGFRTMIKPGLELRVQDIFALNFEMQIGSAAESITMEDGAPMLQAETATAGQTIARNAIEELPTLTRNPYDFIGLISGAVPALNSFGKGVGYAVNGQRSESASFLLDGTDDNTNPDRNNPGQTVPNEAVREYRVLTNGFTAEYGRSAGFIANLVTKSGTNEFHGSLYDYSRNSALAANSFENNALGKPKNSFNAHHAGGSLGGAVVADTAFFFVALESVFVRSSDSRSYYVPTRELIGVSSPATQAIFRQYPIPSNLSAIDVLKRTVRPFGADTTVTIPAFALATRRGPLDTGAGQPENTVLGMARLDYAPGSRTTATGRYEFQRTNQFSTIRQPYTPDLDQAASTRNHNVTMNITHVWSPRVVSESRIAFNRLTNTHSEAGSNGFFRNFNILGESVELPSGREGEGGPRNLYHLHHTVSWVRNSHFFKFGMQAIQYRDAVDVASPGVWANFPSVQGFVDGLLTPLTAWIPLLPNNLNAAGESGVLPVSLERRRHTRYTDTAWFVEDTWKVTRRLTLTPGLRWEYFGVQSSAGHEKARDINFYLGDGANYYERFANGKLLRTTDAPGEYRNHFVLPDRNNFAPRLGLVFDLTGDGRTLFRASAGVFFDATFNRVPPFIFGGIGYSGVFFQPEMLDNPYALTGQQTFASSSIDRVDPDRRTPYVSAWNLSIEREIGGNLVLSGAYLGSSGSSLELSAIENGRGSGRYVGRPGERLLNNHSLFYTVTSLAHSTYHSMQLTAESRSVSRLGLQFGANYTWSHSIDNASERVDRGDLAQSVLLDLSNPRLDRASSSFDQRHRFVTYFIWKVPTVPSSSRLLKRLTENWEMSGILSFQTGQPFQVVDGGVPDVVNSGRPRVVGELPVVQDEDLAPDPQVPNRFLYLPANKIRSSPLGTCIPIATPFACLDSIYGPLDNLLPRNYYRRPGSHFEDIAFTKNVLLAERARVQLRAEFYNIFNHANLELVPGVLGGYSLSQPVFAGGAVAGVVARYGGPPRQVVLAGKVIF
jgi:hypothetical protein